MQSCASLYNLRNGWLAEQATQLDSGLLFPSLNKESSRPRRPLEISRKGGVWCSAGHEKAVRTTG